MIPREFPIEEIRSAFRDATVDNRDYSAVLESIHEEVLDAFDSNFVNKIDESGAMWAPRKEIVPQPHSLLVKTGLMLDTLTDPASGGHIKQALPDSLTVGIRGTEVPYAIFHETGTSKMVPRRYLYLNAEYNSRVMEQLADGVMNAVFGSEY